MKRVVYLLRISLIITYNRALMINSLIINEWSRQQFNCFMIHGAHYWQFRLIFRSPCLLMRVCEIYAWNLNPVHLREKLFRTDC